MKALIASIYPNFEITAIATHIWTVVIAVKAGGFFAGIASFFLPLLSEIYWIAKVFERNQVFVFVVLLHFLLVVPGSRARKYMPY
jgi:cytochrome c biogenesis protein CcdA